MSEILEERIVVLKKEKENWLYLAEGLTYDHQSGTKLSLIIKANNLQERINELELLNKNE